MVWYCPIWSCMGCMFPYGPALSCMVPYGSLRSHMVPYGSVWSHMVPYMVLFGPVCSCMVMYDHVLSYMVQNSGKPAYIILARSLSMCTQSIWGFRLCIHHRSYPYYYRIFYLWVLYLETIETNQYLKTTLLERNDKLRASVFSFVKMICFGFVQSGNR